MTATEAEATAVHPPGTPKLNKALSQLQGELPQIKKTKTGKVEGVTKEGRPFSYEYSYADLGDVVADVGPLLAKYGLAFHCAPTINPADRREMIMPWALLHESGEEKTGEWPLGPASQKPQSLGSAITYGRRYAFTAATNIVLEDDDDGQRAQKDHDTRQSAGDAWEDATPDRPPRQQPQPASAGPSFYRRKLAEADTVTTPAGRDQLAREAADAAKQGLCTPGQATHIQNRADLTIRKLELDATPADAEDLARQAAAGEPEPDYDTPGTATTPQIGAIWTVLTTVYKFGKDEKDQARAVCSHITQRPLASTKDMSRNEAKAVLDVLAAWRATAEENGAQPREFLVELMATAGNDGEPA
jgi:hypothetical protein